MGENVILRVGMGHFCHLGWGFLGHCGGIFSISISNFGKGNFDYR